MDEELDEKGKKQRRVYPLLKLLLTIKQFELVVSQQTLAAAEGNMDPEMVYEILKNAIRDTNAKLVDDCERVNQMLSWWQAGHKNQTSYDVDATLRRWDQRSLHRRRQQKRQQELADQRSEQ